MDTVSRSIICHAAAWLVAIALAFGWIAYAPDHEQAARAIAEAHR